MEVSYAVDSQSRHERLALPQFCLRNGRWLGRLLAMFGAMMLAPMEVMLGSSLGIVMGAMPSRVDEAYESTFPAMGTTVTIQVFAPSAEAAEEVCRRAQDEVLRLQDILSDYDVTSEISRLSQATPGTPQRISNEVWDVLAAADRWHTRSGGAFDASLGNLTVLWRKARKEKRLPDLKRIEEGKAKSGWDKVHLLEASRDIVIDPPGVKLDLGAIAKGYIVDRAFAVVAADFPCCLVRSGGDMRCGAAPPGREGWRIAIGKLKNEAGNMDAIMIHDRAIASSGDLFQGLEWDGIRYSHVIDAKTGMGIQGSRMATVLGPSSMDADAAATALCVMGVEGLNQLATAPEIEARYAWLDASGAVQTSQTLSFPRTFPLVSQDK
jgi:FAD:protein FMN transferase